MNSEGTHKTILGGSCSICAVLLILIVFTSMMFQVFVDFNYNASSEVSYMTALDGHEPYSVSSEDLIPAIQILNFARSNKTLNIADYVAPLQVNWSKWINENGTWDYQEDFIELRLCKEVYPEG